MEKILDEIGLVARTLDGYVQHIYAVDQVEEQGTRTVLQKNFIERLYNDLQYLTLKLDEIYSMIGEQEVHQFPNADEISEYSHITISFTLIDVLNTQVESIQQAVNSLNGLRYTDGSTEEKALLRYAEEERAKQYRYSEFDERIFRGGKKYDPTVLFKWLEERFDDDSGYFDPYSDDYDVMEHFEYLKSELVKKLETDMEWAEAYYKAEAQAGSKS